MPNAKNHSRGVRAALFVLSCYKAYLSVLFAGTCRYEPTCSRYAYEAIERFGVARGVWLGLKRLLACQPLSRRFGYDPVPEKWEEMPRNGCHMSLEKSRSEVQPLESEVRS
jgi:putative membrane protein insertion efficiency factor